MNWTTENIKDLSGKTVIITGANSGLGYSSTKELAKAGAKVIMACRNLEKGEKAKNELLKNSPTSDLSVKHLDLGSLESVKEFADDFIKENNSLDILINNAGIMMPPLKLTKDGFESQVGVNHLGHFALTARLLDLLKHTPGARVVNVSSIAHRNGKLDFDNFLYEDEKDYSPSKAYGRSKLSNLLFTYELQRYFERKNLDVIAVAAHPGISETNLVFYIAKKWYVKFLSPLFSLIMQSPDMGALPQLRAAVDPEVKGGQFYGPGGKREFKGYPVLVQSNELSHNKEAAQKLWELSEKLTGVSF